MDTLTQSQWQSPESAPLYVPVIAYGYTLQPYSGIREDFVTTIVKRGHEGWFSTDLRERWNEVEFEPIGWQPIPELPDNAELIEPQSLAAGQPLYQVGQRVRFETRYEGWREVTIISVINWPTGWWYELDLLDRSGHGNPSIGAGKLRLDFEGNLIERPARQDELTTHN